MPNPTMNDVHVDRLLTNMAISWYQSQDKFFADQIFPYVPVSKQGGKYFTFDKDDLLRDEAREWIAGVESAGSGYRLDNTATYSTKTYAFHHDIGDDVRANSDDPLQPERNATQYVMQKLMIKREKYFGDHFMTYGGGDYESWTNEDDVDSGTAWAVPGTGTPLDDIFVQAENIQSASSYWPNVAVMGSKVYQELIRHDDFTGLYKHTRPGILTKDIIADVLDLETVFVGRSIHASNNEEGTEAESYNLPEDAMLLIYVPESPQIDMPSAGYTFGWTGMAGADGRNITIANFRMDWLSIDRVEGKMAWDMKQTSADMGALLYDCVT